MVTNRIKKNVWKKSENNDDDNISNEDKIFNYQYSRKKQKTKKKTKSVINRILTILAYKRHSTFLRISIAKPKTQNPKPKI